jgi:hypothetical protein
VLAVKESTVMGGLIFGPDFGVSRLTGGAWSLPSPPYSKVGKTF